MRRVPFVARNAKSGKTHNIAVDLNVFNDMLFRGYPPLKRPTAILKKIIFYCDIFEGVKFFCLITGNLKCKACVIYLTYSAAFHSYVPAAVRKFYSVPVAVALILKK